MSFVLRLAVKLPKGSPASSSWQPGKFVVQACLLRLAHVFLLWRQVDGRVHKGGLVLSVRRQASRKWPTRNTTQLAPNPW